MRKITLFSFLYILFFCVKSQGQIAINLFPSPAKQFFIDDLWKTTLINASTAPINAYVQLVIRNSTNAPILTVTTQAQNFSAGINHLTSSEGINGKWIYGNSAASAILQQTGKLPFGSYTFCATVFAAPTNKNLGTDCMERDVAPISPPLLSSPSDKEEIATTLPVLVWIPPRPIMDIIVTYNLRLVEVQSGQTPSEALLQNPALLNLSGLTTNTLNYPADGQALQAGKEYAWQVAAGYEGYNLGVTDVWVFKIKAQEQSETEAIIYPFASKKSDGKFYVSHGIFRFAYNNKANETALSYAILPMGNKKERLKGLPDLTLKPGTNKLIVDIRKNPGLKKNTYYNLAIKDSKGQIYKLLYYYIE